jgi:hypothetical protein
MDHNDTGFEINKCKFCISERSKLIDCLDISIGFVLVVENDFKLGICKDQFTIAILGGTIFHREILLPLLEIYSRIVRMR